MTLAEAKKEVECCNTHLTAKTGRPPVAVESGVDTWRLVRYLDDDRDLDRAVARCDGRGSRAPEKVAGHVVGVIAGYRMLWMEGHPAGVVNPSNLAHTAALPAAEESLLGALADEGIPVGRDAGVGRLDLTTTLRFSDGAAGTTFLAGLAALDVPRTKPKVIGRLDAPETVYRLAERSGRLLSRAYDKGLEANTAPRGELIRLEAQTRYTKEARMPVHAFAQHPDIASSQFTRRFAPVAESADGLTAATLPVVQERVRELVTGGDITARQGERLLGYLALQGEKGVYSMRTRRRRRQELREAGLVLGNPMLDPIEVDLGDALDAALEAWSDEAARSG